MIRIFSQYVSAKSFLLMITEGLLVALSLVCAAKLRFWNDPAEFATYLSFPDFLVQSAIVVIVCLTCFYCNDLYDLTSRQNSVDSLLRLQQSLAAASLFLGFLYFLIPSLLLGRGVFIIGMFLVAAFVIGSRKVFDTTWQLTVRHNRTVILGTGELAGELAREITRREDLGIRLAGFVSVSGSVRDDEKIFGHRVLGLATEMESIVKRHDVSQIVVALDDRRGVLPTAGLVKLRVQGVRVDDAPTALAWLTGRISLRAVRPSWFVFSDGFRRSKWNDLVKRTADLVFGLIGLLVALPLMVLVGVAIRLDSKGPILYRQTRVGAMGRDFEVLKFRSMKVDAEPNGAQWATQDDPRVTRLGRFLRKYRLDELPQFVNLIRGDMSFVGPRPERPCFVEELRKIIPYYDERHSVRPGLTGWAQVQYQYGSSVEDAAKKLEYDLFYLKNMSITFDLAIIFQTIRIVLNGHGGR
jgi:sugar transferase (PEP-CTERM system associated)